MTPQHSSARAYIEAMEMSRKHFKPQTHACDCEHACHFPCACEDATHTSCVSSPNGNPGHRYGVRFARDRMESVSTIYGTMLVCPDCAEECLAAASVREKQT